MSVLYLWKWGIIGIWFEIFLQLCDCQMSEFNGFFAFDFLFLKWIVHVPRVKWHWFFCILQTQCPLGWPGSTTLSGGTVQQPYGRYRLEPTSPTSVESIRMVTLRIKLNKNIVQGEIDCCSVFSVCLLFCWAFFQLAWQFIAWILNNLHN